MKLLYSIVLILNISTSYSQNFSITSQKVIGGSDMDNLKPFKSPYDNGFYFIGGSRSNISGDKSENSYGEMDIWLIKTDVNFNVQWDKTYGGTSHDIASEIIFNEDTLIILGHSSSPISGNKTTANFNGEDVWILEVNPNNGNILAQHTLGGNQNEGFPKGLIDPNTNELIVSFSSSSSNSGTIGIDSISWSDVYVCRYDLNTQTVNNETYIGATDFDELGFINYINSEIVVGIHSQGGGGNTPTTSHGQIDTYFFRLNENLETLSSFNYGGNAGDNIHKIIQRNGEIYALGSSNSTASGNKQSNNFGNTIGFWMIKFDQNFNYIYDVSYGGFGDDLVQDGYFDNNGRLVIGLSSYVLGQGGDRDCDMFGGADIWIIILEPSNGSLIKQVAFGGSQNDLCNRVLTLDNSGNLLISGTTLSPISGSLTESLNGGSDEWLLKVDASNYLSMIENEIDNLWSISPNPSKNSINIKSDKKNEKVTIFNTNGKSVISSKEKQINTSRLTNGIYFITIEIENGTISRKKFIKE